MRPAARTVIPVGGLMALLVSAAAGSVAGAAPTAAGGPVSHAVAIRVSVPGGGGATAGSVAAPSDSVATGGGFAYPADGSLARAASVSAGAFAVRGAMTTASASSQVTGLSLFNGEVTAASVTARVRAQANARSSGGDTSGTSVSGLTVLGQAVSGGQVNLGDWGYAIVGSQSAYPTSRSGVKGYTASSTALIVRLTAEHNGLPPGTEVVVGYADATAEAAVPLPRPQPKPEPVSPGAARLGGPKAARQRRERVTRLDRQNPAELIVPLVRQAPSNLAPKLTAGGYVFPVYGPSSFSNTFGAPRATTGWHHGEDIFAPLGAPILAVADGTVFSVGWNDVGGLRLWLRDRQGNEFYYAHLSAFSQHAVNGRRVDAGTVLGFVGSTGDAEGTPYHLHFEIHPSNLLHLGYDGGAVSPYEYLLAWRRLSDVEIAGVAGWAPPIAAGSSAPRPGAILLHVADISSANGLEPGSLRRAMRAAAEASDGSLFLLGRRVVERLRRLSGR